MAQYTATAAIELVQRVAVKSGVEMTAKGFENVENYLGVPYGFISNLFWDARTSTRNSGLVTKRESHMMKLLNFMGFNNWDSFKATIA